MDVTLSLQFGLAVVAGLTAFRQLAVIASAERGRKHDLVKKLYKAHPEYHLSVLIPFLDGADHAALLALLQAIDEQDYPGDKVSVHLVASDESARHLVPQSLRPNVKVWRYPTDNPRPEHALTWLIERCLAAGGNGMFVFLRPTDMVKADFFQNIVSRGMDSFAIQGYLGLKNPPETPMAKVHALLTRLFNRIGNAGRYHMGLSCRLLDSGWAIKQEVLEMIPYHRGMDVDNLEYTVRLNLENFRVNWAPNVVVYADSDVHFLNQLIMGVGAFFNRLRLVGQYGPSLLVKAGMRLDFNYLEQFLSLLKPPFMLATLLFGLLAGLDAFTALPVPGDEWFWTALAGTFLGLNLLSMVVARCRGQDYGVMLFWVPMVYLLSLPVLPVALALYLKDGMDRRAGRDRSYRSARTTRFNEALEPAAPPMDTIPAHNQSLEDFLATYVPVETNDTPLDPAQDAPSRRPRVNATPPATGGTRPPREQVKAVTLSNGKKNVNCLLKTHTTFNEAGQELYQLTLEYKTMAFSTATYRILDQAYYELYAKLSSRGLTMMTCGSCGYFYNPTADVPGALKNAGVCLFGKAGHDVNLTTDAVSVVSQACPYHCDLEAREKIVKQWKDSLAPSRSR